MISLDGKPGCPQVVVNALALFWVTDSISERSAGGPATGTGATLDHPVYEMSLGASSRHKDPGASIDEMASVNHRHSRQSWSALVALDRGFRMLFVREPTPHDTGTIDLEVSSRVRLIPRVITKLEIFRLQSIPRQTSMFLLFMRTLGLTRRKAKLGRSNLPSVTSLSYNLLVDTSPMSSVFQINY